MLDNTNLPVEKSSNGSTIGGRALRRFLGREESTLLLFLLAVILVFAILEPSFFKFTNAINVIRQVSILAIAAFGMTFAILSGGFDLSVGAVSALAGVVASMVARNLGSAFGIPVVGRSWRRLDQRVYNFCIKDQSLDYNPGHDDDCAGHGLHLHRRRIPIRRPGRLPMDRAWLYG